MHVDDVNIAAGKLLGRRVRLDDKHRVVYQPATTRRDFGDKLAAGKVKFLIHSTGAQMVRAKGDAREAMPPWCLTLCRYFRSVSDMGPAIEPEQCLVCSRHGDVAACPVCGTFVHERCLAELVAEAGADGDDVVDQWKGKGHLLSDALEAAASKISEGARLQDLLFKPLSSMGADPSKHEPVCSLCWPLLLHASSTVQPQ
jgi:hypothetical protein